VHCAALEKDSRKPEPPLLLLPSLLDVTVSGDSFLLSTPHLPFVENLWWFQFDARHANTRLLATEKGCQLAKSQFRSTEGATEMGRLSQLLTFHFPPSLNWLIFSTTTCRLDTPSSALPVEHRRKPKPNSLLWP